MRSTRWPAALLAIFHCMTATAAAEVSANALGLSDVIETAEQRLTGTQAGRELSGFQSSTWLAALPSIAISYLGSNESQGTDESELILTLPLKSPHGRRLDQNLRDLAESIGGAETARRRLYLSGLIREALWSERIAETRAHFTGRKIALLEELLDSQEALFEARSASRYSLLLIRQELVDAKVLLGDKRREVAHWRDRYRQLTGLGKPPGSIEESALQGEASWHLHPELRLLELTREQQRARIAASSANSAPWNLSLLARRQDSKQLDENQYGLAIEVPLDLFDTVAESSNSEWREAAREYWRQRDELQLLLENRWLQLAEEAKHLQLRQALLAESATISRQLLDESRQLFSRNELGSELWIRRLLGNLDREAEAAINQALIGQNHAMRRQAAGIPL
jgi:hypothetical protein